MRGFVAAVVIGGVLLSAAQSAEACSIAEPPPDCGTLPRDGETIAAGTKNLYVHAPYADETYADGVALTRVSDHSIVPLKSRLEAWDSTKAWAIEPQEPLTPGEEYLWQLTDPCDPSATTPTEHRFTVALAATPPATVGTLTMTPPREQYLEMFHWSGGSCGHTQLDRVSMSQATLELDPAAIQYLPFASFNLFIDGTRFSSTRVGELRASDFTNGHSWLVAGGCDSQDFSAAGLGHHTVSVSMDVLDVDQPIHQAVAEVTLQCGSPPDSGGCAQAPMASVLGVLAAVFIRRRR